MIEAPIPSNDAARLETLRALQVLDSSSEERFDRITRLARRLFGVPIALVSLVDAQRQWFKSRQGLDATETPRGISFCGHAVLGHEILTVPNAAEDERFADNPLVTGAPGIRFYAGCPVSAPDGQKMGTLCIIDVEPRELGKDDLEALRDLAGMVEQELAALALATTDPLTGLSNRRGFETLAGHALAVAARSGRPVTLLFIDLDRFKQINDELGHAEGDRALVEMSRILLDVFRESDVVARIGGDEFCVLISGTPPANVAHPLARLEAQVQARNQTPGAGFELLFSTGVVSQEGSSPASLEDLMARADRCMYEQKRGRADGRAAPGSAP